MVQTVGPHTGNVFVRDDEYGASGVRRFPEEGKYRLCALVIQIGGRLVGKEDQGMTQQCARDSHALQFPARERGRHFAFQVRNAETGQNVIDPCLIGKLIAIQRVR